MANGTRNRYDKTQIANFMKGYQPGQEEAVAAKAGVSTGTVKKSARIQRGKKTSRGTGRTNGKKLDIQMVGEKGSNGLKAQITELRETVLDLYLENWKLKRQLEKEKA